MKPIRRRYPTRLRTPTPSQPNSYWLRNRRRFRAAVGHPTVDIGTVRMVIEFAMSVTEDTDPAVNLNIQLGLIALLRHVGVYLESATHRSPTAPFDTETHIV